MKINRKKIPVETVSQMRGRRLRMVEGVSSSMIYLIYCKNLCKCHNVPPPSITIKSHSSMIV
jgi:hypothetical protein